MLTLTFIRRGSKAATAADTMRTIRFLSSAELIAIAVVSGRP